MLVDFIIVPLAARSWVFDQSRVDSERLLKARVVTAKRHGRGGESGCLLSPIERVSKRPQVRGSNMGLSSNASESPVHPGQIVSLPSGRRCSAENTAQKELAKAKREDTGVP